MKHTIKIIFGKEEVNKFLLEIPLSKEEKDINVKEYQFATQIELAAFINGINEAVGWTECYVIENVSA